MAENRANRWQWETDFLAQLGIDVKKARVTRLQITMTPTDPMMVEVECHAPDMIDPMKLPEGLQINLFVDGEPVHTASESVTVKVYNMQGESVDG